MVKSKDELKQIGATKPTVTVEQESGGIFPAQYIALDLSIHATDAEARAVTKQIQEDMANKPRIIRG